MITLAESSSKLWKPVTIHWKHVDITVLQEANCVLRIWTWRLENESESWFDSQL